jgi:hypothetical protein
MSKRIWVVAIVLVIVSILLLIIYFESQSAHLDKVSLTLEDLNDEGYREFDKEYITEPYIASNETLFAGWSILEKYHVLFKKNDSCFIVIDIAKLTSKECKEFISTIENSTNLGYDFTELDSESIGEESFIGEANATIFETDVTLYFIGFRVNDIVVAMVSSGHTLETSIDYVKIMENNILSN